MSTNVNCLTRSQAQADHIVRRLNDAGIDQQDMSIRLPDPAGRSPSGDGEPAAGAAFDREMRIHDATDRALPAGGTGGMLSGRVGWIMGAGLIGWLIGLCGRAISGLSEALTIGSLSGTVVVPLIGAVLGGVAGTVIGMRMSRREAGAYRARMRDGRVLISVRADDAERAARIATILDDEGADEIVTAQAT